MVDAVIFVHVVVAHVDEVVLKTAWTGKLSRLSPIHGTADQNYVQLKIHNIHHQALIDTGAYVSCIFGHLFKNYA